MLPTHANMIEWWINRFGHNDTAKGYLRKRAYRSELTTDQKKKFQRATAHNQRYQIDFHPLPTAQTSTGLEQVLIMPGHSDADWATGLIWKHTTSETIFYQTISQRELAVLTSKLASQKDQLG